MNVFNSDWDVEERRPGYAHRRHFIGRRLRTELLGASVWDVPPGARQSPYHFHHANEELLVVLTGRPTLRTPDGERQLSPGDVAAFPRGPEGAHQLANATDEPVRYLLVSTRIFPDVLEYPDSRKLLAIGEAVDAMFPRDAAVDYWEGEPPAERP